MTKVTGHKFDPAYEIHLALYQAITGREESDKAFKKLSPDFFDLIVIDECHRGSAADDAQWREILDYFGAAIQVGMTATPRETKYVSNINYFGDPVYTYSLKQGIEDGFLAPYKVIRIDIDKDIQGWTPPPGTVDDLGQAVPEREYNQVDMDTVLILNQRTRLVAQRVMQYLERHRPFREDHRLLRGHRSCRADARSSRQRSGPARDRAIRNTWCESQATAHTARRNSTISSTRRALSR